jgi:hypothetical protein
MAATWDPSGMIDTGEEPHFYPVAEVLEMPIAEGQKRFLRAATGGGWKGKL